jgi:hypothetical protein
MLLFKELCFHLMLLLLCDGDLQPTRPLWGPVEGGTRVSFDGIRPYLSRPVLFLTCDFGITTVPAIIIGESTASCISPRAQVPSTVVLRVLGNISQVLGTFQFFYFGILNLSPLSGEGGTAINILLGGLKFPRNSTFFRPICHFRSNPEVGGLAAIPQSGSDGAAMCRFEAMANRSALLPPERRCIVAGSVFSVLQSRITCVAPILENQPRCSASECLVYLDVSLDGGASFTQEKRAFIYLPVTSVLSLSLSLAPFEGGTTITVRGSNFKDVPQLSCRYASESFVSAVATTALKKGKMHCCNRLGRLLAIDDGLALMQSMLFVCSNCFLLLFLVL